MPENDTLIFVIAVLPIAFVVAGFAVWLGGENDKARRRALSLIPGLDGKE